jgi:alcohol dehydrogenase
MVMPFSFYRCPVIEFGTGSLNKLADHILRYGKTVLLVTGGSSFTGAVQWPGLLKKLKEKHISYYHTSVSTEPSPAIVDEICRNYAGQNIEVVTAIGGGSVIDAAKAVSAMIGRNESVKNYLEGVGHKKPDGVKKPFIAVPTTSGTGSEATSNAVISEVGINGFKKSLRHINYVPDVALVDPVLTLSCPPQLTAACGMDAFTQLTEAYLSPESSFILDSLLMPAIKQIQLYYIKAVTQPGNMEARTGMAYASLVSGIGLANAGLGTVHGFASPIGSLFDIPHGIVCGSLMAPANRKNVAVILNTAGYDKTIAKYAGLGKLFSDEAGKSDAYYCRFFIDVLDQWFDSLEIPFLSDYGMTPKDIDVIVKRTGIKNNPVQLEEQDLKEILSERIR